MLTRRICLTTLATSFVALTSLAVAADDSTKAKETMHHVDHHNITLEHLVTEAKTTADHEAVAKRLDAEAAEYDKKAAEHERMAVHYRKAPSNPKLNNNASALATHCDHLAVSMKESARDAREMAQLHRDLGKALAK